jgi:prevent-host-death family protein
MAWVDSANSVKSTELTALTELSIKPNMAPINPQMEPNMQALTFRNQQGDLVDLTIVAASEIKLRFGALLDSVVHGAPVAISKHDEPKAVLLSMDEFRALVALRQSSLDVMTSEFDELLESMQTKQAKTGIARAFASSPKQLGAAAAAVTSPAVVTSRAQGKTKPRGKAEKTSARVLPKSTGATRSTHAKR